MIAREFWMRYSLIAFFLVGAVAMPAQSDAQIFDLSERQEIELGREAAKKVESDLPILKDREISDYVDEVGQKLVRRSQRNNIRYNAGYNPDGMVTFFEKLEHLRKSEPSKLDTFFSTHPNPAERVANVSKEIRSLPRTGNLVTDTRDFEKMKERLVRMPKPPAPRSH